MKKGNLKVAMFSSQLGPALNRDSRLYFVNTYVHKRVFVSDLAAICLDFPKSVLFLFFFFFFFFVLTTRDFVARSDLSLRERFLKFRLRRNFFGPYHFGFAEIFFGKRDSDRKSSRLVASLLFA